MSNHTLLTICAFMFLSTILLSFYRLMGSTGDDIGNAQDMILATTIATSYMELAQGLAFDEKTDTVNVGMGDPSGLTPSSSLGPDSGEDPDSIGTFNDFDDFNRLTLEKTPVGSNKRFATNFRVYYINPSNVDQISGTPTFLKRMDLRVWRTYPPNSSGVPADTLRLSIGMGYFHFD
jgi:hypothetical protein